MFQILIFRECNAEDFKCNPLIFVKFNIRDYGGTGLAITVKLEK